MLIQLVNFYQIEIIETLLELNIYTGYISKYGKYTYNNVYIIKVEQLNFNWISGCCCRDNASFLLSSSSSAYS